MAMAFSHRGALYIVLDEENIERIQQFDPFDFHQAAVPPGEALSLAIPLTVVVAYARREEQATIAAMTSTTEVVKYLRRGYREMASDHERGEFYRPMGVPKTRPS